MTGLKRFFAWACTVATIFLAPDTTPAVAGQMGYCVFGTVRAPSNVKLEGISFSVLGQNDAGDFYSDWVFAGLDGAYQVCGLSSGSYKLVVSPEPQAPVVFELPFDVRETHQYHIVRMTRERNRMDFSLGVQPAPTAILGVNLDRADTLQQPLGSHANAAGRYLPGVLVPVLATNAPVVLGALPTTLEYAFHGLDWRNPLTGGPLGSLELSGLPMNQWQLAGLDASNRASGGSAVQWSRPKMPNRISGTVGLQWQPQDSVMLTDNAQASFGETGLSLTLSMPVQPDKLWVRLDAHLRDSQVDRLGRHPENQHLQGGTVKGDLIWRPSSEQAVDLSFYWTPSNQWRTTLAQDGEVTEHQSAQGMGVFFRSETQLADGVTWENRAQYHQNFSETLPDRCPNQDCSTLHLTGANGDLGRLPGWNTDERWRRLKAATELGVTVPLRHWRWPVRAGLQYENIDVETTRSLPGVIHATSENGQALQLSSPTGSRLEGSQGLFGWYLTGDMRLNAHLMLLPGLRWDHLGWSDNEENRVATESLAPRFGFKVFPTGASAFEIRGGFFQYNDVGTASLFAQNFNPADVTVRSYNENNASWEIQNDVFGTNTRVSFDDNLALPVLNEALLGFKVGDPELHGSADAVYRHTDGMYAFYEQNLQWSQDQSSVLGSFDGTANSHLLLANYSGAFRTYWGMNLNLKGILNRALSWHVNYTFANLEGTLVDYYDDRDGRFGTESPSTRALELDVRHRLNLQYSTNLRPGLTLSQIWHYQSGAPAFRSESGELIRFSDRFLLQTRMIWQPPIQSKNAVAFYADVINLFNSTDEVLFNTLGASGDAALQDPFVDPLRVQFGLRYGF